MKYEIETYKGQLIEYDDSYDKFLCDISTEDKFKTTKRSSLADVRKEIDQFIKLNADFKPFKVLSLDNYDQSDFKIVHVVGIRTDGKFITHEDSNAGYKSYSGKKDIKNWMIYNHETVAAKKELKAIKEAAVSHYNKSVKELAKKLVPIDLSKYEHIINPE